MIKLGGILTGEELGGWSVIDKEIVSSMPQDLATGFNVATSKMLGSSYKPLHLIAEQIVNGKNYLIVAEQTKVVQNPEKAIVGLIINIPAGDFGQNAQIVKVIDEISVNDDFKSVFEKAIGGLVGANYKPLILIGTQVVKGINYHFICEGKLVIPNAEPFAAYVVINQFGSNISVVSVNRLGEE